MFSSGSATTRPSFSLSLERSSSSRSRSDQTHTPGSSAKGSMSRIRVGARDRHCRDSTLILKGGKRHHAFDERDAPYPLSYDPKTMDVDIIDHVFLNRARKSVTWVDFKDKPPTRSLDLGCGNGVWILEAAKEWKDCQFVGFDLVRIQPKLSLLPRDVASRVQWIQGNFLTGRLPFEDGYFDYVHVYRIAWGISEMKWDGLFEEISRVLRPGGAIEVAEEDILFPTLPPSYSFGEKRPRPSAPYPRPSLTLSPPPSPLDDQPGILTHAHAVLESLFFGVFESRMINLRPTAIIPHHLNIYFRNVLSTYGFDIPFPPPQIARQLRHCASDSTARPMQRRENGPESSVSTFDSLREEDKQQRTPPTTNSSLSSLSDSNERPQPDHDPMPSIPVQVLGIFNASELPYMPLIPPAPVDMNDRDLALQLNSVYHRILSCKEAMWEELRRRLILRRAGGQDLLQGLGWDDEAENDADSSDSGRGHGHGHGHGHGNGVGSGETRELERARARFDELTARFERDWRYRTALADALQGELGWPKPAPSPMSKHERAREAELEKAMAAAALAEADQVLQYSRSFKCFVGFKEGKR